MPSLYEPKKTSTALTNANFQTLKTTRMKKQILTLLALVSASVLPAAESWKARADWLSLPSERDKLGNMHGDVAVSSAGEVYVSVQDSKAGVQVYGSDGQWIRNVKGAPSDFHGFVIHKDKDGEFLYGPRLGNGEILKMSLDGEVKLRIPASAIPAVD